MVNCEAEVELMVTSINTIFKLAQVGSQTMDLLIVPQLGITLEHCATASPDPKVTCFLYRIARYHVAEGPPIGVTYEGDEASKVDEA